MEKMLGLVGGLYSKRVNNELKILDETINITRMWSDIDELLKELATSRSFVEELDTVLILDVALDGLSLDHKKEKKLLTLQNELSINNSDINLKFITSNQYLYIQLRNKLSNVHNRLYENFEIYSPNNNITPLVMLSFLKGDTVGVKPPSKNKVISKVDWNAEIMDNIKNLQASMSSIEESIEEFKTTQEKNYELNLEIAKEISEQLKSLENKI